MSVRRHRWDPICPPPRGLVRPVRLDATGERGPTRGQVRSSRFRRTSHGYYVPADVDRGLPEQRILEESMWLVDGGAVTGWASCRLHSANFFDGLRTDGFTQIPVPLCVGRLGALRTKAGITVSREQLHATEVVILFGIPCTEVRRALFDAMRTALNVREAAVCMDMMAAAGLVSIAQMRAYVAAHPGWKGVAQVRAALNLASEHSRSPNETRMRLVWELDAGLPRPRSNQEVFDRRGRLLGIADLLDLEAGVVGEFDGADHRSATRQSKDIAREEGFRGVELEYFKVTGLDLHATVRLVQRMHATYARASRLPESARLWTITPPPSWHRTPSLDDALAHRAWELSIYERYEREDREGAS